MRSSALTSEATSQKLCSLLKPFHLTRNWNLLWCQWLFNISSTFHSFSLSMIIGGGGACGFLPRIRSSRVADNFTMLNTGCNCLILWDNLSVIAKSWRLKSHPRWMFRKNLMEFFVGLLDYLYKFYRGYATTNPRSHVLLEYSTITWPSHVIWLPKFPCYL